MKFLEYLRQQHDANLPIDVFEQEAWDLYGAKISPLVIDSVGFSRTTSQMGITHFVYQMAKAQEIMEAILNETDVMDFSFKADNCFAHFKHPDSALQAALLIRKAVQEAEIPLVNDEIYGLSMGIGYGEMLFSGGSDGYYGNEMNLAAKLGEDTGERDDILLTEDAKQSLSNLRRNEVHLLKETVLVSGLEIPFYRLCDD
jgi:class 3 adenylate cyclase